jgi:hypothetical protein
MVSSVLARVVVQDFAPVDRFASNTSTVSARSPAGPYADITDEPPEAPTLESSESNCSTDWALLAQGSGGFSRGL